jgi:hypothetical protein
MQFTRNLHSRRNITQLLTSDKRSSSSWNDSSDKRRYNVKKGLRVFGEAGAQAVVEEMQQLHNGAVIQPKLATMLTKDEKRRSLQYLMFLKQKRCGRIKGRGCADGRKQRIYKNKEDTSAPTVSVESLFLSCVIDAKEQHKVITCDIPGAFMQAEIDEVLHI